jgi:hypothetical protein
MFGSQILEKTRASTWDDWAAGTGVTTGSRFETAYISSIKSSSGRDPGGRHAGMNRVPLKGKPIVSTGNTVTLKPSHSATIGGVDKTDELATPREPSLIFLRMTA